MNQKSLLFLFVILISCNSTGIEKLEKIILPFSELPDEVKSSIFDADFIELNKVKKITQVVKQNRILPWVYNTEVHRKVDGKIFKISLSPKHGSKYVILNNYLYIPRHYNINKANSSMYHFTRFELK